MLCRYKCILIANISFTFLQVYQPRAGIGDHKRVDHIYSVGTHGGKFMGFGNGDYDISQMLSVILIQKMDEGGFDGLVMPCVHMDNMQ